MRITGCAGAIAAALLAGVTTPSPVVAQVGASYSPTIRQHVQSAYFARSQGNCTRFESAIKQLQYYRIHTATFSQEAARAIRELREDGCPRGTGTGAAAPVTSGRGGGFYIGVNTGYGWGSNEIVDPSGGSVGVQGGYGVELGSGFFVGVEAGFKYGGVSGSTTEFGITEEQRQNWTVSFLGRVGVAAPVAGGPLIYVTLGPTLANTEFSVSGPGFRDVDKQVLSGLTGGIGAEIAITPNVSVGAQYLHTRYRSGKFFDGTIEIGPTRTNTFNLIGNYRFGVVGQ